MTRNQIYLIMSRSPEATDDGGGSFEPPCQPFYGEHGVSIEHVVVCIKEFFARTIEVTCEGWYDKICEYDGQDHPTA